MATHSSILAWRIPWTEEPGRQQSIGSQRVGHDWSKLACTRTRHRASTNEPRTPRSSSLRLREGKEKRTIIESLLSAAATARPHSCHLFYLHRTPEMLSYWLLFGLGDWWRNWGSGHSVTDFGGHSWWAARIQVQVCLTFPEPLFPPWARMSPELRLLPSITY